MLRLAVTTAAETLDRMRDPLAARDIAVEHLDTTGRVVDLSSSPERRFDAGFVYPARLMAGGVVDGRRGLPWVNGRAAVATSRNKAGVIARLSRAGLPVPETRVVSNPADDDAVAAAAADIGFPIVIKPNSATRGIGVAKVHDRDSLLGVSDYADLIHEFRATGDKSYLLQEFLPDARDYRLMVVDGTVVGGVERRRPDGAVNGKNGDPDDAGGGWKHNVHRGATAVAADVDDTLRELAVETADVLEIDYLGVDLLVSEGRAVVSETNARPTIDDGKYDTGFWDRLAGVIRRTADGD
ncbi:ATP-grasp domain-containing protein [Halobellus ruber]|uniref:RimK family alpha-L-glutamate ligase n=1 Tax=Halobellus ruber TaxID=2761102 RepID=A0A7J9SIX3_9EURY|nr:RimK family alpha-L-glutamate ligase [Halobellus ruber]MBB6646472.1 RimK family alpha-L-glutamate ligase [Halobellus ruber]